ncbi:hypothetical protein LEP1GSC127_1884 [Leptospira kirschneri str. 200801925]|uniref:Uncharacterized protein n=1 Tax=Leptospira kirschneri serovar Bulgarica str. Nikolaevo TaxID=1240687 RepID=M6FBL0_9LEPT|nr:hypothetical protein LEP1GSC018_1790 [Leptospira kirschneri str. 2008720114]EMK24417.1 hypothetical protein LEP1GSC008_3949 [Leptospira kirschneri serovar Bulgarica str. Nikolaevo]EMO75546.1 hypothetical protein LEP1GSC127_1884 [Leptospira kirschneri str. 200801925]
MFYYPISDLKMWELLHWNVKSFNVKINTIEYFFKNSSSHRLSLISIH